MHAVLRAKMRRGITAAVAVVALLVVSLMTAQPASATFAGNEGKIAFERLTLINGTFNQDIWSANPDASSLTQLTTNGSSASPSWSPDGNWIAYTTKDSVGWEQIAVMRSDGTQQRMLTSGSDHHRSPTWNSDGTRIAYVKGARIMVIDLATIAEAVLYTCNCGVLEPEYSPDGRYLAYSRVGAISPEGNALTARLMLLDLDTAQHSVWAEMPTRNTQAFSVSWHPDSSAAVWQWVLADGTLGHLRAFIDGSPAVTFTTPASSDWAMSPTGLQMAVRNTHNGTNIRLADLSGQQGEVSVTSWTNTTIDSSPAWQPTATGFVDVAPPVVTVTAPVAGTVYLNTVVNANFRCDDSFVGSGIASCVGTVPNGSAIDTSTLGAKTFSVTAKDNAGNVLTEFVHYNVVLPPDTTDPTVTITSPTGADVIQGSVVAANYSCADDRALASCVGTVPNGSAIDTSTLGAKTFSVTAIDAVGNDTVKTVNYTVVAQPDVCPNIAGNQATVPVGYVKDTNGNCVVLPPADTQVPTISVTSPTSDVLIDSSATAQYTCADNVGVVSCVGSIANGGALDTATVGVKSFTVTARDAAGNQATTTVTYNVLWPFGGFTGPVDGPPTLNAAKAGGTVPVKFSLGGNRGLAILKVGYPTSSKMSCTAGGAVDTIEEYASTPGNNTLSYDSTTGLYGYNWKTDKAWSGTCRQFTVKLADGSTATANFQFK